MRVGRVIQEGNRFYALENSWGHEWGLYGFGLLNKLDDDLSLMSPGLYTARLPDGWQTFDGWKQLLIRP